MIPTKNRKLMLKTKIRRFLEIYVLYKNWIEVSLARFRKKPICTKITVAFAACLKVEFGDSDLSWSSMQKNNIFQSMVSEYLGFLI